MRPDGDDDPELSPAEYRTFSFKCRVGADDDLIEILAGRRNRSNFIRRKLRLGLRLPEPAASETLTVDTLRSELDRVIGALQSGVTVDTIPVPRPDRPTRRDVNDNGNRIPDF